MTPAKARRLSFRLQVGGMRRARLMACALLALLFPAIAMAENIVSARYTDPTTRYAHGILGDAIEWGTLEVSLDDGTKRRFILPDTSVFEDTHPRLVDLDADSVPEIVVVETSLTLGARLVVYGPNGRLAQTDYIGRTHRWQAPVGAADFTGDGRLEIATVVTPHLAGKLEVLAYDGRSLTVIATAKGLTNHRIGDTDIAGGIRNCGDAPQMILAQMPWRTTGTATMVAVNLTNGMLETQTFSQPFTEENISKALACQIQPGQP